MAASKEKQLNALELIHALFSETNPIPVKAAMSLLDLPSGPLRLPLVSLSKRKETISSAFVKRKDG